MPPPTTRDVVAVIATKTGVENREVGIDNDRSIVAPNLSRQRVRCRARNFVRRRGGGPKIDVLIELPNLHRFLYSLNMAKQRTQSTVIPITEAATRGVSDIARQAENGVDIILTRHGKPVAVVMSVHRADRIAQLEEDLVDAALVLSRMSKDDGQRFSANDVLAEFGIGRSAKRTS